MALFATRIASRLACVYLVVLMRLITPLLPVLASISVTSHSWTRSAIGTPGSRRWGTFLFLPMALFIALSDDRNFLAIIDIPMKFSQNFLAEVIPESI